MNTPTRFKRSRKELDSENNPELLEEKNTTMPGTQDYETLKTELISSIGTILDNKLQSLMCRVDKLETDNEKLQIIAKEKNLIIFGILENSGETSTGLISGFRSLLQELGIVDTVGIDDIYRITSPAPNKTTRPIVVKFISVFDKRRVLALKGVLSQRKIFIKEDRTTLQRKQAKLFWEKIDEFKKKDPKYFGTIRGNSLYIKREGRTECSFFIDEKDKVIPN